MTLQASTRNERFAYALMAAIAMLYVAVRAWAVPFISDEARTFFLYNAVGRFMPWHAYWDAANHVLCTALAQLSYRCFGPAAWSLRLFSVLSFLLYAVYIWRFGLLVVHRIVRWTLWLALLFTPFVIDFFGLYRGYGSCVAFFTMALYHLVRYATGHRGTHWILALFAMALATFASLSLMILWCAFLGSMLLLVLSRRSDPKQLLARLTLWVLLGALPLVYLALYGMELNARGALYVGNHDGLVQGTLGSLCWHLFQASGPVVLAVLSGGLVLLIAYAGCALVVERKSGTFPPLAVFGALLLAEVSGRIILGHVFGVPYPSDRTAVHLVPLAVLLFVFAIDRASTRWPLVQLGSLVLLVFPWNMGSRANFDHPAIWANDMIPEGIYREAETRQRAAPRPLAIGGSEFLRFSWALRNMAERSPLAPLQQVPDSCNAMDLMLVNTVDTGLFPMYRPLHRDPHDRVVLCERIAPLFLHTELDTIIVIRKEVPRSLMLWEPKYKQVEASDVLVQVDVAITSPEDPLEVLLVSEADRGHGQQPFYRDLHLSMVRSSWQGDTLRTTCWIPMFDHGKGWCHLSLLNERDQRYTVGPCHVRVFSVVPDSELGAH